MFSSSHSPNSVFTIVVVGLLLSGCSPAEEQADASKTPPPARPVKTLVVKSTTSNFERTYSAVISPSQEADLSFRVSGRIIELPIKNGTKIKQGDVIAQLDKRNFEAKITQIESQLAQSNEQMVELKSGARAEDIATLQADVAAAQAQVDAAKSQVSRTEVLFKKKIIAKAKLDQDVTNQRVAEATLEAKQQALIKGQAGARKEELAAQQAVINGIQSQLESAKDDLSDATLRAPFDGIIAVRKVENFSNIQAKEPVAILHNLTMLDAIYSVPAPDVARLATIENLDLNIVLEGIPDRIFKARHKEFSTLADAATQTYRGRVTIEDLGKRVVLPGMTGDLIVSANLDGGAIMLPLAAVVSSADGKSFVWEVDPTSNKVSKRDVDTGDASGENVIISKGLKGGEIVATVGLSALQDGMVVKPVTVIGE